MAALASGVREGYLDAAGPFFPLLAGAAAAAGVLSPLFLATAEVGTVPPLLAAAAATAAAAAASAAASAAAARALLLTPSLAAKSDIGRETCLSFP